MAGQRDDEGLINHGRIRRPLPRRFVGFIGFPCPAKYKGFRYHVSPRRPVRMGTLSRQNNEMNDKTG